MLYIEKAKQSSYEKYSSYSIILKYYMKKYMLQKSNHQVT